MFSRLGHSLWVSSSFKLAAPAFGMGFIVTHGTFTSASETDSQKKLASDAHLNLLALEYGYKYRLDICATDILLRMEFVRTLREARYVARPLRRSGSTVRFFKIGAEGDLHKAEW
jgi:hypothetical protein